MSLFATPQLRKERELRRWLEEFVHQQLDWFYIVGDYLFVWLPAFTLVDDQMLRNVWATREHNAWYARNKYRSDACMDEIRCPEWSFTLHGQSTDTLNQIKLNMGETPDGGNYLAAFGDADPNRSDIPSDPSEDDDHDTNRFELYSRGVVADLHKPIETLSFSRSASDEADRRESSDPTEFTLKTRPNILFSVHMDYVFSSGNCVPAASFATGEMEGYVTTEIPCVRFQVAKSCALTTWFNCPLTVTLTSAPGSFLSETCNVEPLL